jgi:hypothetical protein
VNRLIAAATKKRQKLGPQPRPPKNDPNTLPS